VTLAHPAPAVGAVRHCFPTRRLSHATRARLRERSGRSEKPRIGREPPPPSLSSRRSRSHAQPDKWKPPHLVSSRPVPSAPPGRAAKPPLPSARSLASRLARTSPSRPDASSRISTRFNPGPFDSAARGLSYKYSCVSIGSLPYQ
jgi:hypothetical protein